ncbi:MAG TPA: M20 family metallopeptidase [Bacteroidia bacterium]|nr:M20 family metallopeptidase [Bacteroidia bacterium]
MLDKIKSLASDNFETVLGYRRHIHANPELSYKENNTADYIASILDKMGIPSTRMANTGVIAILKGNETGKTIALRADIDALPIEEKNDVPYKSKNVGVMHACGHDVHTSMLLGAAKILKELSNEWNGTIKLIFQPGEEKLPGGASILIKEGVLENPTPEAIIAQHVFPSMETGKAGFASGSYMAACDEIYLTVKGKGGHAALPKGNINPLLITSEILLKLERAFMYNENNKSPIVLAFGKMTANGATNIIPNEVKLEGTYRTMDENSRDEAHRTITDIVSSIAKKWGGDYELKIDKGYPVLVNNEELTIKTKTAAEEYLGKENVVALEPRMTSEDFAYYSHLKPSCFYRLGTGNVAKGITSGLHTPTFNVDEKSLEIGMGLMAWLAINELKK